MFSVIFYYRYSSRDRGDLVYRGEWELFILGVELGDI